MQLLSYRPKNGTFEKTQPAKRAQKIRKTDAKNRKQAQSQKVFEFSVDVSIIWTVASPICFNILLKYKVAASCRYRVAAFGSCLFLAMSKESLDKGLQFLRQDTTESCDDLELQIQDSMLSCNLMHGTCKGLLHAYIFCHACACTVCKEKMKLVSKLQAALSEAESSPPASTSPALTSALPGLNMLRFLRPPFWGCCGFFAAPFLGMLRIFCGLFFGDVADRFFAAPFLGCCGFFAAPFWDVADFLWPLFLGMLRIFCGPFF